MNLIECLETLDNWDEPERPRFKKGSLYITSTSPLGEQVIQHEYGRTVIGTPGNEWFDRDFRLIDPAVTPIIVRVKKTGEEILVKWFQEFGKYEDNCIASFLPEEVTLIRAVPTLGAVGEPKETIPKSLSEDDYVPLRFVGVADADGCHVKEMKEEKPEGELGIMKTTKVQFETFKAACLRYQKEWGLLDYQLYFLLGKPKKECYADIQTNDAVRAAMITLTDNNESAIDRENFNPVKHAKHEMCHLLIARLTWLAACRYLDDSEINEENERLVVLLEKILPSL